MFPLQISITRGRDNLKIIYMKKRTVPLLILKLCKNYKFTRDVKF